MEPSSSDSTDPNDPDDMVYFQKFGDVFAPGGALVRITDIRGVADLEIETIRAELIGRGIPITPELEAALKARRAKRRVEVVEAFRAEGVPEKLKDLLSAPTKKEALKLCREMTATKEELSQLIFNSDLIGYTCTSKHREFTPGHLVPARDDHRRALQQPGSPAARKFVRKLEGVFRERRRVTAHLFERGVEWHCFYFDYKDAYAEPGTPPHWVGGTHVHYLSYLWGKPSKADLWAQLEERRARLPGTHIAFRD